MCTLVVPSLRYKQTHLEAFQEFQAHGENLNTDLALLAEHLEVLLEWIGKLTLRPHINERFLSLGGHIGYEIRPSKRRQGYGVTLLRLGLEKAREQGLRRVLLTCDETNIGSKKIIEANGGCFANAVHQEGSSIKKFRYWIDLSTG